MGSSHEAALESFPRSNVRLCPDECLFMSLFRLRLQKSAGSELQEIMRRRQEKLAASTCDSGVESFDEGGAHWAPRSSSPSFLPPSLFPPSAVPYPFFKPQPAALSILRRRPTARSSWRSCGVDRNSSAHLHRNKPSPPDCPHTQYSAMFAWSSHEHFGDSFSWWKAVRSPFPKQSLAVLTSVPRPVLSASSLRSGHT